MRPMYYNEYVYSYRMYLGAGCMGCCQIPRQGLGDELFEQLRLVAPPGLSSARWRRPRSWRARS